MAEIKFELRKRKRNPTEFWSINYDPNSGKILSIEAGQSKLVNSLVVSYPKVKNLLAGVTNQNDFRVAFNEKLGALDLVDVKRPTEFKKKHVWRGWLSTSEYYGDPLSDIRVILFNDTGMVRVEATRAWSTQLKERLDRSQVEDVLPLFITDEEDPHQLFGYTNAKLVDIIERGFYETRLWSFMNHDSVQKILYQGQKVRINVPPVASNLFFTRIQNYFPYSGVADDQTVLSHQGRGKHISVFVRDGGVWAQSHYEHGSPVDQLVGNLPVAVIRGNDPEAFVAWAELPALMLRQPHPFEIIDKWPHLAPPSLLYKANNLDIGVMS